MGFIDGSSTTTWPSLRWEDAQGISAAVGVTNITPNDRDRSPSVGVPLTVAVDSNTGSATDVQFQVATDSAFANIVATATLTAQPNGTLSWQPAGLAANTTYYWRARGAPTGTTTWGPWSGTTPVLTAVSGTWTASGVYGGGTAANAGGDSGINFGSAPPVWVQVQAAAAKVVSSISFRNRAGEFGNQPSAWTVQGSNDGSTWTTLDTKTGQTVTDGVVKTFPFSTPNTTAYLYYRMNITATAAGGANWTTIRNLSFILTTAETGAPVPWQFLVDVNTGRAMEYVVENVGALATTYQGDIESSFENVGFQVVLYQGTIESSFENVGFRITLDPDDAEYVYIGDVNDLTPTPHIWWMQPSAGRPADSIALVGFGFGDLPGTYGGVVEMLLGSEEDGVQTLADEFNGPDVFARSTIDGWLANGGRPMDRTTVATGESALVWSSAGSDYLSKDIAFTPGKKYRVEVRAKQPVNSTAIQIDDGTISPYGPETEWHVASMVFIATEVSHTVKVYNSGAPGYDDLWVDYVRIYERLGEGGWAVVPIVTWQTFPPSPDAYTAAREMDEATGTIDPQHQVIEFTVPASAVPPGYGVRVRTEGP